MKVHDRQIEPITVSHEAKKAFIKRHGALIMEVFENKPLPKYNEDPCVMLCALARKELGYSGLFKDIYILKTLKRHLQVIKWGVRRKIRNDEEEPFPGEDNKNSFDLS